MGFRTGAFAKVWEVTPMSDTSTKLRMSISRRNKKTDEYEQDFSGFVLAVGTAVASKAAKLKEGDRIKLGDVDVSKKTLVDGTPLEPIVKKYAVGVTRSGGEAKSYTLLDVMSILRGAEDAVKSLHMEDLNDITKVRNFYDVMGYIGYTSDKPEDRKKLYVTGIKPLHRKRDDKLFGYSLFTKSIGSGKESRFTVFCKVFDKEPVQKGDIIYCKAWERDGAYFRMLDYEKVY